MTVPLPLLDAMLNVNGTALAQTNEALKPLYVTWYFGNGIVPGKWKPTRTGAGTAWELSPLLAPLMAHKSHLTVISGLENKCVVGGTEHPSGSAGSTTGANNSGLAVRAKSIDQIIADTTAAGAPFRSLELGVTPATPNGNEHALHSVSHNGPNSRNNAEYDPKAVFKRLFMDGTTQPPPAGGGDDAAAKLAAVKKSVLDAVIEDGVNLQKVLGAADKQRLDQHLTGIRAIEKRLQATTDPAVKPAACGSATAPTVGKDTTSEAPVAVNTAMAQLTSLALACEKTRVATYMFSLPAAHVYYRHLAQNMNDDFHDTICHGDAGDQNGQARVETGVLYAMRSLNEFLTLLKDTPHGAGTLLDASLVYVTSDTAWGKIHTRQEWPVLMIGKANGRLRGDEHHNFPNDNLSKALLTAAQAAGSPITELGLDNGKATAPLSGVLV